MDDPFLDAWDIHTRMVFKLFDAIPPEAFVTATARSVGSIFSHMNNTRVGWVENSVPALAEGLIKIPAKTRADREAISKALLRPALERSAEAMRGVLAQAVSGGRVKNFKPHVAGRMGYFLAHEWYHLGEISLLLGQAGHKIEDTVAYGIWDWRSAAPPDSGSEAARTDDAD